MKNFRFLFSDNNGLQYFYFRFKAGLNFNYNRCTLYSQFQTRYDVCQKLYSVNETRVESSESKSKRRLNVGDFL